MSSLNEMTKFGLEVSEASERLMKDETCEEGEGKEDCGENKKDENRKEDDGVRMLVDRPESLTSHSTLPPTLPKNKQLTLPTTLSHSHISLNVEWIQLHFVINFRTCCDTTGEGARDWSCRVRRKIMGGHKQMKIRFWNDITARDRNAD
ncbi:hypothetical protein BLNAU_11008 [Blattamonas nauphoetae]|uniref:Uncharacterized protein n=1 Tax=Blattamonas nauphoetae TaxID=2049346 RepID=A0ABQ9XRQ2_9EUKA|nr:hypothetical protein BLNAU_11008 [Blattamonas nauphoetae]